MPRHSLRAGGARQLAKGSDSFRQPSRSWFTRERSSSAGSSMARAARYLTPMGSSFTCHRRTRFSSSLSREVRFPGVMETLPAGCDTARQTSRSSVEALYEKVPYRRARFRICAERFGGTARYSAVLQAALMDWPLFHRGPVPRLYEPGPVIRVASPRGCHHLELRLPQSRGAPLTVFEPLVILDPQLAGSCVTDRP